MDKTETGPGVWRAGNFDQIFQGITYSWNELAKTIFSFSSPCSWLRFSGEWDRANVNYVSTYLQDTVMDNCTK